MEVVSTGERTTDCLEPNERYLGVLMAVRGSDGPAYTLDFAGEEDKYDEPAADDWRLVLEYLIDHSAHRPQ